MNLSEKMEHDAAAATAGSASADTSGSPAIVRAADVAASTASPEPVGTRGAVAGRSLQDNLTAQHGRVFLTGNQALVRMALSQRLADRAAGLNTAGFVTGYRGSPLGGVDQAMWRAGDLLKEHDIRFQPAINEDLAATMVMGTQQAGTHAHRRVDGVFALWYGKGPGLDRAGDAIHHGNAAGASARGGVLMVVGDDHMAASSSIPHASETSLIGWRVPVINPASIEEYEWFARWGWALSRYSGAWVAFKAITETVESGRGFALQDVPAFDIPEDDPFCGATPYSAREFLTPEIELRMARRLDAVQAFSRRYSLDRLLRPGRDAVLGIVSTGKASLDAEDALDMWRALCPGIELPALRHYKIGLSWPLDRAGLLEFARGLDHILVVEEKAPIIEGQVKDILYNSPRRPTVCGEYDLGRAPLLARTGQFNPAMVAHAVAQWLSCVRGGPQHAATPGAPHASNSATTHAGSKSLPLTTEPEAALEVRAVAGESRDAAAATGIALSARPVARDGRGLAVASPDISLTARSVARDIRGAEASPDAEALTRRPYFCSGCPHSTSTRVPEGSHALAGVGCHYMATWMDRDTGGLTQMGGEGADWIGLSGYIDEPHVFQNMGEGTYFHSGFMAIRQAVAAGARITYKILYNDAVAMTGGQPVDGPISVPGICQQLLGEGVRHIVVTTDDPKRYRDIRLPHGVIVHPREELDALQRELREEDGVTVLIHDQACAAEKRRRRKKKTLETPARRVFINTAVCEGCGDCSRKSNCLSVVPVDTPLGRKRAIDQSSCNQVYSCVDGFCPSFVSVIGGKPRTHPRESAIDREHMLAMAANLPEPLIAAKPQEPLQAGPDNDGPLHPDRDDGMPLRAGADGDKSPPPDDVCNVLVAGIGGTGVMTVSAIIGMAAHLEGRAVSVLDITGLAQKGGAVAGHVRIARGARSPGAVRIGAGQADVAILCDPVAACQPRVLQTLRHGDTDAPPAPGRGGTHVTLNTYMAPTAEFLHDPDARQDPRGLIATLRASSGCGDDALLDAHDLATHQLGDGILANMVMLGHAWQRGALPLTREALMQAIKLNGVAVQANTEAFELGRLAAARPHVLAGTSDTHTAVSDLTSAESQDASRRSLAGHAASSGSAHDGERAFGGQTARRDGATVIHAAESLGDVLVRYGAALTAYQNAAYARAHAELVERVKTAEQAVFPAAPPHLALVVAHALYKLMAFKDEYEVARLYTDGAFRRELAEAFEGDYTLQFHLAPPLFAPRDPRTGHPRKITLGPAMEKVFRVLARFKPLRGTWLDPFGYTAERRLERQLIKDYRAAMLAILSDLDTKSYAEALELAALPQGVRGFGYIKEDAALACQARLRAAARAHDPAAAARAMASTPRHA